MYRIGDKVVHPMHGAGVIDSIVQRKVNGQMKDYYLLNLSNGNMMVMIPTDNTREIGVRPVVSGQEATRLIQAMESIQVDMTQNWNRRYRVVKGLACRDHQRGLSTGERKMLHVAKQILISELVLAQSLPYETVEARVDGILAH